MGTATQRYTHVVVAGGGPAGFASAIALAQAGMQVHLCDPNYPQRQKACGEGLLPRGLAALQHLGVSVPTQSTTTLRGIAYHDGALRAQADFAGKGSSGVRRTVLMAALEKRAIGLGVHIAASKIVFIGQDATSVQLRIGTTELRADALVVADGLQSPLRAAVGLHAGRGPRSRYGVRQHFACAPWSDRIEVFFGDKCEAYVTPVAHDCINVAFLAERGATRWASLMQQFPALQQRLADKQALDSPRGAGPFWQKSSAVCLGRVALVGDAAGYVDAITGEGVSLALCSAVALAQTMAAQQPLQAYAHKQQRLAREYSRHARLLLWLSRSRPLRRLGLRLFARVPSLLRLWVQWATGGHN